MAGYPGSDVTEHNKIDLNQAAMETAFITGDWTLANQHYSFRGGSSAFGGSFCTLKGFPTDA